MKADDRLLLFGGPYSNLQATQAILAEADRRGIPADRIVCTGDVVAYGGDPVATIALLRGAGVRVVMGNCEERLSAGAEDCGCGYAPGSSCDRLSQSWFAFARRMVGQSDRDWMRALPRRLDIEVGGLTLAVVHGSLGEINRFVFASTPERVKALDLMSAETDGIVGGHSGLPFSQVIEGRLWHNPGVAGMPANDGTARAWYSVLKAGTEPRSVEIEHACLDYGHEAAAAAMRLAGLPGDYAAALSTGLWPSCDVLPRDEAKAQGRKLQPGTLVWRRDDLSEQPSWPIAAHPATLSPAKFRDPAITAMGERRASVGLGQLKTLWINTGTLCNLACTNCYIESSPTNDRLTYLSALELTAYLDEIERDHLGTDLIGFTGGEPFMNPDLPVMLEDVLSRGMQALVLTNAMKPMAHRRTALLALTERYGDRLTLRVSVDHYTRRLHELERGPRSWQPTLDGLAWLTSNGFSIDIAGRLYSGEAESVVRAGYARLFLEHDIPVDAADPVKLVLFPEMDARVDVPEITEACWGILGKSPGDVMCASSRMVVKRKGAERPAVLACTLLPYDPQFEMGSTLAQASGAVALNHPHCAKFCVLGGASCSAA